MKTFAVIFLLSFFVVPAWTGANSADPLVRNVVETLKHDIVVLTDYGAHQRIVTTKMTEQGTPKRVEEKILRTIWVHNKAQNELVSTTCKDYDVKSGRARRCFDVKKASSKQASKPGKIESEIKKIRWTELHKNFEFTVLPKEGTYQVFSFRPKQRGTTASNRIEKLLGAMGGKVWVDNQYRVIRAEAKLVNPVSFGLGVAAKVHHLGIQYNQQAFKNVYLPSSLIVDFKAKIALLHTERQRIEVMWRQPYKKTDTVWAQAMPVAISNTSTWR